MSYIMLKSNFLKNLSAVCVSVCVCLWRGIEGGGKEVWDQRGKSHSSRNENLGACWKLFVVKCYPYLECARSAGSVIIQSADGCLYCQKSVVFAERYMCLGFQMSLTWTHKVIFGFLLCSLSHKLGLSLIFCSTGYCCNVGSSVWCGAILPAGGRPTFITKDMASLIS